MQPRRYSAGVLRPQAADASQPDTGKHQQQRAVDILASHAGADHRDGYTRLNAHGISTRVQAPPARADSAVAAATARVHK